MDLEKRGATMNSQSTRSWLVLFRIAESRFTTLTRRTSLVRRRDSSGLEVTFALTLNALPDAYSDGRDDQKAGEDPEEECNDETHPRHCWS